MLLPFDELVKKYLLRISGVLHVGAHEGEENSAYKAQGIQQENIYWIEANPTLCYKLARDLPNVIQCAVSDKVEQVTFHVTNNYQSSSILDLKEHRVEHPHIHVIEKLQLSTNTLDFVVETNAIRANFLNMDIQGAELKCLKGFEKNISMIDYVYTEINTKELYSGCALLNEMDDWLNAHGFERKETRMTDHGWGDAFYMRKSPKKKWLLVDRDMHVKNKIGLQLMCAESDVELCVSNNPEEFGRQWELVYVPRTYIDPSDFPHTKRIVYGPHNFVFVEGVWKQGNHVFPSNCYYNLLSEWVDDLEKELGGMSLPTKLLPFPVELHKFTPAPEVPKTLDCFVYFKHRPSYHFTFVLKELMKRGLSYRVIKYGAYSEEEFLQVIRSSKFGIWIGGHESQGFALEEALACNTPLLVWNSTSMFDEYNNDIQEYRHMAGHKLLATSHPYWDDSCGISFTDSSQFEASLNTMLETYDQFHPRDYIEKTLSPAVCMQRFVKELELDRKDLFLITSVVCTGDIPWSYAPRSVYSPEERFQQTLESIQSIRTRHPSANILLIECSDLPVEYANALQSSVDYYMNVRSNEEARRACLETDKKGFGEAVLTKLALQYVFENNLSFERLFKLSGRYALNDDFSPDMFSYSQFTFKKSPDPSSISTILYSVPHLHRMKLNAIICNTVEYYKTHGPTGYETIVPQQCTPQTSIDRVGAQGYVAVNRGEVIYV
jgi:FkbM family methyltransferase